MLSREEFFESVIEEIKCRIPEDYRSEIDVNVREVIKTNDEIFHGVTLVTSENGCVPTIYLEDCYEAYQRGASVEELAEFILLESAKVYMNAKNLDEVSFKYEDIQDKLIVQLVDSEKNKERLKKLVYEPVGNGFVMIPYVVVQSGDEGRLRTAVTEDMAQEFGYDRNLVMKKAFENTVEQCEPVFMKISDMFSLPNLLSENTFVKEDVKPAQRSEMYILTNKIKLDGATVLFYPGMMEHVSEILEDDYYVLPSSLHETIIVPKKSNLTLKMLQEMVKEVNEEAVEPKDILSDKVLLYNRKTDTLVIA